ncbi:hypothetical protein [Aliarcobacter skirrowii]|uniref:Uncharacterized protein n=1 Tax=Aliarcobacter skirrowii TaxID=28200 RepID=A0AAW9DDB7_9BACT|nr:hypothetical protein [Aliarcobacter skirrowii]MDX4069881.1 hypothetical protein [Aliarcobacter skirrowii]
MTFDKAYCEELKANITAYKARREYFSQNNENLRFKFYCPDENCNVELTGVNIYTLGKTKNRPHFRTKINSKHTDNCSIVVENEDNINKKGEGLKSQGHKFSNFPEEFILNRPKKEVESKGPKEIDFDDEFDIEPRIRNLNSTNSIENKPHRTSYLENVVDSFESMNDDEKKDRCIVLNGERKSYKNTFKNIKYCEDGTNFIFYGDIKPVKKYGDNFAIQFKDNVWFNGKFHSISIYITSKLINEYRLCRLFENTINTLAELKNKFESAKCYFVGAYPMVKTLQKNGSEYDVLEVIITNLDHLVIKFTE